MGITKFIARRLAFGVLTLLIVSIVVFALTQALGDPVKAILGRDALPDAVTARRADLGLDRPLITQYWDWLTGLLTGDPGTSFTSDVPVLDVVGDRVWNSLFLMAISAAVSIPISIVIGSRAAARRDTAFDAASSGSGRILASMPEFVTGLLLLVLFSTNVWHIFPAVVRIRPGEPPWVDLQALVLPVMTLTLAVVPYVSLVMRASMIEVLESDYIEMARLKGAPERTVMWRHAMPNALGPVFQVIAINVAYFAAGVIVVEYLFNYPGIGSALVAAVRVRDIPVIQFLVMVIAAVYVVTNLLADIGTILVTPRLRTRLS